MATQDVGRRALENDRYFSDEIERLRLLLEASSTLLGSLDVDEMLPEVLELANRTLAADAYALWRRDQADGSWTVAAYEGLTESYVESATNAISGQGDAVLLDEPLVAEDIAAADWISPAHRRAHDEAGTRAMLVAGLRYADRVVGTLVFYYRAPRSFTEAEKGAASLLANLAAAAIGTAELYQAQRRLAEDQRFVAQASELLASSLEYESTLANVAALAVPAFADWCAIDMVQPDGTLGRLAIAHVDPEKIRLAEELADKYPPDPDAPYGVPNVIRTRRPELFAEIDDDLLVQATADTPELLALLRELGLRSSMCVPLIARDRVLGAITFMGAESGRRYDEGDLATAQDLARRAAIAVDNALLFSETQAARREALDSLAVVDAVFAAAPVGLAFMDTDFKYVRVNDALAAINGLAAEEHYGRSLRDVLGDELAHTIEPYHRHVLETGEAIIDLAVEGQTAASPGELRSWLVSYYPVRHAGDVTGVGVVITDVTERERARAAAEAAGERLSVLAEVSQQLAGTLDYESTLANLATLLVPRFADWYAVDVVDGRRFRRIAVVHRDPSKQNWAEQSMQLFAPQPDELEGTARVARTGEAVLYRTISDDLLAASTLNKEHHEVLRQLGMESAMCVPLTAAGRTFGALMLVSADPERLFDEEDLDFAKHLGRRAAVAVDNARLYREAERRARAALVVQHVADGVVLVSRAGLVRLWNPAAEHITGLPASEALGRPAAEVFTDWESIAALAESDEHRPVTHAVNVNARQLWLSLTAVGFDDGTVYAFRDLTEERAVDTLKSDFVSTISHELRTPLAAIYGAALTLRREDILLGEPQRTELLEVIASESDRLARIVNDVLWISRLESDGLRTKIEPCDPVELARTVVDAARSYIPQGIKLELTTPRRGGVPPVFADADKVRQVLTNLVENAVKYSPDGGRVTVDVSVEGPRARFSVRDEGLGVPPAEHRRIFEKFYRLDPDLTRGVGGTGLGLYISRELLERMGGRIWVESSGTGGSTFVVELPLVHD